MYFSAPKERMLTMECNVHVDKDLNLSNDSIYRRKLRPLVPRPICSTTTSRSSLFSNVPNSPCFCIHTPNFLSWRHSLIGGLGCDSCGDKSVINTIMPPLVSTRWNPTREQLQALEEMYKRGTRTPSAEQIQQIATKLRRFGKIEGKNVFYWFQNHKARERQKKRRQLELLAAGKKIRQLDDIKLETKPTGLSRRYFEIEHSKKLPTPTSCTTLSEGPECNKKGGWDQIITAGTNETCWKLNLSSCVHPDNTVQTITAQRSRGQEDAEPLGALDHTVLYPSKNNDFRIIESGIKENQTLQLFPVKSIEDVSMGGTKFAPNEFIEFLPTKK